MSRWFCFFGALFLLLTGVGCGLDDYEKRMDIERKRVRNFDAEEANLGGVLEPPTPPWPFEVYLRVPIGFEKTPLPKAYKLGTLFLYRYQCTVEKPPPDRPNETIKPGWNLLVGCSKVGELSKSTKTFNTNELSEAEFQQRMLKVLREYYRAEYEKSGRDYEFKWDTPKPEMLQPDYVIERTKVEISPIEYKMLEFTPKDKDANAFQVYFQRTAGNQIAIIFQVPEASLKDQKFVAGRNHCLKSLDISEKATEKKIEFLRSHKAPPPKKT